jgi:formamidopyrimidine-DNA glycosylase
MGLELPEILNISKQLNSTVKGKTINDVALGSRCASLVKLGMCNLDKRKDEIINRTVNSVQAKGKWIFLEFNNDRLVLLGELIGKPGKYIRIMDKESTNKECKRCGTRIIKMNILGSSSYFCPNCQNN